MANNTIEKMSIELSLEAQNFNKQMSTVNKAIKQSEREFKNAGKGIKDYEKTYVGLDNKIKSTSKQLDLYNTKLKKQKEEYSKLESTVSKQKSKLDELERTVGKGSAEWTKQAQLVQKNSEKLSKLGKDIKDTEGNIDRLGNELKDSQNAFNELENKTKSASERLEEIDKTAELTQREFDTLGQKLEKNGNFFQKLGHEVNQLQSKINTNNAKIKVYEGEITKLGDKLKTNTETHKKLESEIAKTERALQKAKSQYGENSTESQELHSKLMQLKDSYNSVEAEIEECENSLKNYKVTLNQTENEVDNLSSELKRLPFDRVGEQVQEIGTKTKKVGKAITTGVTVPLLGIGTAGVLAFKEVDDGMDNIITATGATGDKAKELEVIYKRLAGNINADFTDVGSALGEVNTRFAFTGKELEKCTRRFLEFSIINKIDTTQAVQLVSRAMGDAGIKAEDYADILDKLTSAAQASGISIDKLTELLTKYGAPMRALGFETKEAIAIFSQWELAGVNTEIAFSGMKAAIGKWGKEGKNARKEFKKTLEEIEKAPNIAKATSKAIEIFGQKAGPDLADAIQGGRFEYSKFLEILEGSKGVVTNTFNEVEDGVDKAAISSKNFKIATAELGEEIMVTLTPILEYLTNIVREVGEWFSSLDADTKQNIITFGLLAIAIGPVIIGIGQFIFFGGTLIKSLGGITTKLLGTTGATTGLSSAMTFLTGPVGIALAVGLFVTLATVVGDSSNSIGWLQEKFGGLGYIIGAVCEFISGAVQLTFGNLIITIMGVCDIIAALLDGPGGQTVGDAWDRMNAKLTLNTEEAMMKITTTTSRGLSQLSAMTEEQVTQLITTADTLSTQIPVIMEGNYAEASNKIALQLIKMDSNQFTTLQGMNDTTKAMFQGINSEMTVNEMSNQVEWNIKQMAQAGKLDLNKLKSDTESAMTKFKSTLTNKTNEAKNSADKNTKQLANNVDTNLKQASNNANINANQLANNIDKNIREAAQNADKNTKNLGSNIDRNTKNAGTQSNGNMRELAKGIDDNTKNMAQKGNENTKKLAEVVDDNTNQMKNDATSNTRTMKNNVTSATYQMANSAINDWRRIRNEFSRNITGRINVTRTTTNVARAVGDVDTYSMPRVDTSQYQTRGSYFNSNSRASVSVKDSIVNVDLRSIEKMIKQQEEAKGDSITIQLNFDKVEIKNSDDYKVFAKKTVEYINKELQKLKNKNRKAKGGIIHA